jgi:ADP-ribose pyrophosphatase YjhB (NUDIX family)
MPDQPPDRPGRIDYYNDPNAPTATTIVPSVNVVVENDKGEILLIRRSDNGNWALPGGAIDIGESLTQAAVREVQEETGIACEITGLVGIYSDPKHLILYTSDSEVRQEFSVVLTAVPRSGEPTPSVESLEVSWVSASAMNEYPQHAAMRKRITDFLSRDGAPRLS